MSKTTDVIVIGSGLAGLMAAWVAASRGCRVNVISEGMGSLAISGSAIDLLGYDQAGKRLQNPWEGMGQLKPEHPYSILGADKIRGSLDAFAGLMAEQGVTMRSLADENGQPRNALMPTIMGTFKPTWLVEEQQDIEALEKARRILVLGVKGFRDCRPTLIISQLRRYPGWENRDYAPLVLPAPFDEHHRSINALDIARVADRQNGMQWLLEQLKDRGKGFDAALLPPMLGARARSPIRAQARETLGCPYVEMLSVPPGVAGLRVRDALVNALNDLDVEFFENALVTDASVVDGNCVSLTVHSTGRELKHQASAIVVATGGIISGGVKLGPGSARESIFGLKIPVPENVDEWTEANIFGHHLVTSLGVRVNEEMRPLNANGETALQNVFFAGRSIGAYDYASEKSGHGVSVTTGWQAGVMAAASANAKRETKAEGPAGGQK